MTQETPPPKNKGGRPRKPRPGDGVTTPQAVRPPQVLPQTETGGFPESHEMSEEAAARVGALDQEAFTSNEIVRLRAEARERGEKTANKPQFNNPDFGVRYDDALERYAGSRVRIKRILPDEKELEVGVHRQAVPTYEKLLEYLERRFWDGRESKYEITVYERNLSHKRAVGTVDLREDARRAVEWAAEQYEAEQARMRASMGNPYAPQQPAAPAPAPAAPAAPAKRFCTGCGAPNELTARFCASCGQQQNAPAPPQPAAVVPAPAPAAPAPATAATDPTLALVLARLDAAERRNEELTNRLLAGAGQPPPQRAPEDGLAVISRSLDAFDSLKKKGGLLSEADVLRERLAHQAAATGEAATGAAAAAAPRRYEVKDGADGLTRTVIDHETGMVEDKPAWGGIIMTVGGLGKSLLDEVRQMAAEERNERRKEAERRLKLEQERADLEERRLRMARGELPPAREEPPPPARREEDEPPEGI